MSKVDSKQDYYADLELKPNAEPEEIKRQFRKLAKLYHPDRNPGKEFEYNAKFQAIQAAHEVLADSQQRAKYDSERQKAATANTFSPQYRPGNTPKTTPTATHFPPPPKRPGAEKARYPTSGVHKPQHSAGNQRFASFKANVPEWVDEAEARANSFRAWKDMGSRQGPPPAPPPRPKFTPTAPRPAPPPPPPHPEPPNSWSNQNAGNAGFPGLNRSQSTRKRPGYAPSTPGAYNEPMAPPNTSAYHHVSRGDRPHASRPQSYFDVPPPSPKMPYERTAKSPLRHAKSQEDPTKPQRPARMGRQTTYARAGGEKTYVGGGVSRSTSLRNSPVDPKYGDHAFERPQSRHGPARNHSAGPHSRKTFDDSGSSSDTSSGDSEDIESAPRPTATPHGRFGRAKPADGHWHTGAVPGNNLHTPQRPQTPHYEYPPPPPKSVPNNTHAHGADHAVPGLHSTTRAPNDHMYGPFLSSARTWSQEWGFSRAGPESINRKDPLWALPATISPECLAKKQPHSLSDPQTVDAFPIPFPKPLPRSSIPQPVVSRKANLSLHPSSQPNSPVVGPEAHPQPPPHDRLHGPFVPNLWTKEFTNGSEHFAPPPAREKSPSKTSTSRGRAYSKGRVASPSKDTEPPEVPNTKNASSSGVDESSEPQSVSAANAFKDPSSTSGIANNNASSKHTVHNHTRDSEQSVDAMDIDDTPPEASTGPQTNGNTGVGPSSHPHQPVATGNSRSTSSGVNLNDLSNVAPFAPSASGLDNMDELGGELPFESRPATSANLNDTAVPINHRLDLPKPPRAPEAPLDGDKLTRHVWDRYCKAMNAYMKEWQSYNTRILAHFNTRQEMVNSSLADNWFTGVGDTDAGGKAGVKTYCGWMEEDEKVRAAWDVSTERHKEAMLDSRRARELAKHKASRSAQW